MSDEWKMEISDYSGFMAQEKANSDARESLAAEMRQAAYDYQDAGGQYGTARYLKTPDSQTKRAHYTYQQRYVPKSHYHHRQYGHRRVESSNWERSYGTPSHVSTTSKSFDRKVGMIEGLLNAWVGLWTFGAFRGD